MQTGETVSFTRMSEGTRADYDLLERAGRPYFSGVANRLLGVLESMRDVFVGYQVSSLEHLLQTATRAERDGADEEMIVAALLRPYIREEVLWIVRHHGIFKLYYSGRHQGRDPNLLDRYRASPHCDLRRLLRALGPDLLRPRLSKRGLDHLAPMLRQVFGRHPSYQA